MTRPPPELAGGQDAPPDVDAVLRVTLILVGDYLEHLARTTDPRPDLARRTGALRRVLIRLRDHRLAGSP